MMSYYNDKCPREVLADVYMGHINPHALLARYIMGFRIMQEAIGMLLRDIESLLDAGYHGSGIYIFILLYKLHIRDHSNRLMRAGYASR